MLACQQSVEGPGRVQPDLCRTRLCCPYIPSLWCPHRLPLHSLSVVPASHCLQALLVCSGILSVHATRHLKANGFEAFNLLQALPFLLFPQKSQEATQALLAFAAVCLIQVVIPATAREGPMFSNAYVQAFGNCLQWLRIQRPSCERLRNLGGPSSEEAGLSRPKPSNSAGPCMPEMQRQTLP